MYVCACVHRPGGGRAGSGVDSRGREQGLGAVMGVLVVTCCVFSFFCVRLFWFLCSLDILPVGPCWFPRVLGFCMSVRVAYLACWI